MWKGTLWWSQNHPDPHWCHQPLVAPSNDPETFPTSQVSPAQGPQKVLGSSRAAQAPPMDGVRKVWRALEAAHGCPFPHSLLLEEQQMKQEESRKFQILLFPLKGERIPTQTSSPGRIFWKVQAEALEQERRRHFWVLNSLCHTSLTDGAAGSTKPPAASSIPVWKTKF